MTEWVVAQVRQNCIVRQFSDDGVSTHSGRFAATSPIKGEEICG
jgi:hypothetical protein